MSPQSSRTAGLVTASVLLALLLAAGPYLLFVRPAWAAVTFVVNRELDQADLDLTDNRCDVSTDPGNQCTLRAAIEEANDTAGLNTIAFNIPGGGVRRIRPTTDLPFITESVTIDGYTQPGATPNTATVGTNAILRVELDGLNAGGADGLKFSIAATNSLVRGLAIGRFNGDGIHIDAAGVRVTGCFIGTVAGGTHDRGNVFGVFVNGTTAVIGNASPAARNLIAGNTIYGVALSPTGSGTRVLSNLIGTTKAGNGPLPNGDDGIVSEADGTFLGGNSAAEANVIQFNGGDGVAISPNGTGNRILRNSIGGNGEQGIDLGDDGRTLNDADDADTGANTLQNFPVITAAATNLVQVTLNSKPNQDYFVRLYSNPGSGDEGVRFHGGPFKVTTNANGDTGNVTLTPNPPIPSGRSVTVTVTNAGGSTSEFSDEVAVSP